MCWSSEPPSSGWHLTAQSSSRAESQVTRVLAGPFTTLSGKQSLRTPAGFASDLASTAYRAWLGEFASGRFVAVAWARVESTNPGAECGTSVWVAAGGSASSFGWKTTRVVNVWVVELC